MTLTVPITNALTGSLACSNASKENQSGPASMFLSMGSDFRSGFGGRVVRGFELFAVWNARQRLS